MKVLATDNRLKVAFTLFLVWIFAVWQMPSDQRVWGLFYPICAIATVIISDLSITFVRDHKFYLPSSSLVTGFLIGLIIAPTEKISVIVLASLFASLSKQLIATGLRQHIFNPAAFGIMTVSLASGVSAAWWGVGASYWTLIILIPLMLRILWLMRRVTLPASFLAVYFLFLLFSFKSLQATLISLLDGSIMLFALVMLPEPITSPVRGHFKWLFGALVAIISIALTRLGVIDEVLLPALLISNLVGFFYLRLGKAPLKTPKTEGGQN